jgi:hypothetical protein
MNRLPLHAWRHCHFLYILIAFVLVLSIVDHADASLGGKADTIETDRKAFQGRLGRVIHPSENSDLSIHEINRDGTTIREYALPDGTVFAVTWRGITQPDLSVLLGKLYPEYEKAISTQAGSGIRRHSRTSRVIRSKNMVIEHAGHMRDVRGKAYLPNLMPEGIEPKDIVE